MERYLRTSRINALESQHNSRINVTYVCAVFPTQRYKLLETKKQFSTFSNIKSASQVGFPLSSFQTHMSITFPLHHLKSPPQQPLQAKPRPCPFLSKRSSPIAPRSTHRPSPRGGYERVLISNFSGFSFLS